MERSRSALWKNGLNWQRTTMWVLLWTGQLQVEWNWSQRNLRRMAIGYCFDPLCMRCNWRQGTPSELLTTRPVHLKSLHGVAMSLFNFFLPRANMKTYKRRQIQWTGSPLK